MLNGDKEEPLNMYLDQLAGEKPSLSEMRNKLRDSATELREHALFPRIPTNDTADVALPLLDLGMNPEHPDRHYYLFSEGTLLDIPKGGDGFLLWDERREVNDDSELVRVGQVALDAVEARVKAQKIDLLDE